MHATRWCIAHFYLIAKVSVGIEVACDDPIQRSRIHLHLYSGGHRLASSAGNQCKRNKHERRRSDDAARI